MIFFPLNMVIFHNYVSLPEGTPMFLHLEKYEFVNGKDYHIYEMEIKHVWNHQPTGD